METEDFLDLLKRIITDGGISFYYFPDPTSPITALYHLGISYPGELSPIDLPYRWHAEKPSENLIDAVWDDDSHSWIENSDKSQLVLIAKLQAGNAAMQKRMENYEAAKIRDAQNNDRIVQALSGVQKGQAQTTAVLAQLVPMMQQFSKSVNTTDTSDKLNAADETKEKEGAE